MTVAITVTFCYSILMARRSSHKNKARRDTTVIANPRLPSRRMSIPSYSGLKMIEDRRTFHPQGIYRPARSFHRSQHRLVSHVQTVPTYNRTRGVYRVLSMARPVAFEAPRSVLVCVRRKRRSEVLHALGHTGKRGQRKPRQSYFSSIRC